MTYGPVGVYTTGIHSHGYDSILMASSCYPAGGGAPPPQFCPGGHVMMPIGTPYFVLKSLNVCNGGTPVWYCRYGFMPHCEIGRAHV